MLLKVMVFVSLLMLIFTAGLHGRGYRQEKASTVHLFRDALLIKEKLEESKWDYHHLEVTGWKQWENERVGADEVKELWVETGVVNIVKEEKEQGLWSLRGEWENVGIYSSCFSWEGEEHLVTSFRGTELKPLSKAVAKVGEITGCRCTEPELTLTVKGKIRGSYSEAEMWEAAGELVRNLGVKAQGKTLADHDGELLSYSPLLSTDGLLLNGRRKNINVVVKRDPYNLQDVISVGVPFLARPPGPADI